MEKRKKILYIIFYEIIFVASLIDLFTSLKKMFININNFLYYNGKKNKKKRKIIIKKNNNFLILFIKKKNNSQIVFLFYF
jgi:hypothetical protein